MSPSLLEVSIRKYTTVITVESNMALVPDLWEYILTYTPSSVLTMRCVNRHFAETLNITEQNPCSLALRDNNPAIIPWLLEVHKIPNNFVIEAARYLELEDLMWLLDIPILTTWLNSLGMSEDDTRTLIAKGACIGSKITTLDILYYDGYKFTESDVLATFSHGNREACEYVTRRHETFIDPLSLCEKAVEHSNLESLKYLLKSEGLRSHAIRCATRQSNLAIITYLFEEEKPTSKNVVYALSVDNLELAKLLHTLSDEILTKEHLVSQIFPRTLSTLEIIKWLVSVGIETRFFVEETRQFVTIELLEWVSENGYEFEDIPKFVEKCVFLYNAQVTKWLCEKKYVIPGDDTMLLSCYLDGRELFELLLARNHTPSREAIEELIREDRKEIFKLIPEFYTEDLIGLAIIHGSIGIIKLLLKCGYSLPEDAFELCIENCDYYTLGFLYGKGLTITREHISTILDYNIAVKYLEFLENYGYKFSHEDYSLAREKENERAAEFLYSKLTFSEKVRGYFS